MTLTPTSATWGRLAFVALLFSFVGGFSSAQAQTRNTTDLSPFKGNFRGGISITGSSLRRELKGKDTLRFQARNGNLRGILRVTGFVRVDGEQVPVNNEFTFAPSGKLKVKEIAPGVTDRQKASGTYTATPTVITFQAPFESGTSTGSLAGTLTVTAKANQTELVLTYSVSLDGGAPLYTYTYTARRKVSGN